MPQNIKYPVVNGKKECGQCHLWLPIEEYKKARNHFVSRCHSCLKAYAAEYRRRPEVREATAQYHKEYAQDESNRRAKNEYNSKRNKLPSVAQKRNEDRKAWVAREKAKAIDYKGGKCCICGYNKCQGALEFHHLDPSMKEGHAGGALKPHWTFEKNKKEIDKCALVCNRCHREIHMGVAVCPSKS